MGECPDNLKERDVWKTSRTLSELIKSRRSIRFFKNTTIPDEHLMMILESARWAPSPANAQPWEFIVIRDLKVKENLLSTMRKVGRAVRKKYAEFPWDATSRDRELISKVPVVVAVCADFHREELQKFDMLPLEHKKEIVSYSIAAAIQNMMLMATSLGLGSLWISPLFTEEIKRLLHVPETLQLVALVALGYPVKEKIGRVSRKPLKKVIHYNEFSKLKHRCSQRY